MKRHLQYLWYVMRHKWYVFVECCKDGIVWRGIIHDLSKFSRAEWGPYSTWIFGKRDEMLVRNPMRRGACLCVDYDKEYVVMECRQIEKGWIVEVLPMAAKHAFDLAVLHHYAHNPHHWNHWIMQTVRADRWHIQEMSIESPKIIAHHGIPLLWCEADSRWNDDDLHSEAYQMVKDIVDKLNIDPVCFPMPEIARYEMLADLRAAGRTYRDACSAREYYQRNRAKFLLHPETRAWLEAELGIE